MYWVGLCVAAFFEFALMRAVGAPDMGQWVITQIPANQFANHPSINNNGEVVWAQNGGGIYSSVRGKLADSGFFPHLANSGEVLYAEDFEPPKWDLVSTTRGRLTFGGIIDINSSDFDLNADGEVVYCAQDTNGNAQIYSTVKGQITFEPTQHFAPCINDKGEIVWLEYLGGAYGTELISSIRGVVPGFFANVWDLNNAGELCFSSHLDAGSGNYTFPHVFFSAHGAVVSDPNELQWFGGLNDAGTIVYESSGNIYKARWVPRPSLTILPSPSGIVLQWPTNFSGFRLEYATNLAPSPLWHPLPDGANLCGDLFRQNINAPLGSNMLFRLVNSSP